MKKIADKVAWLNRGWQPNYIGFCPSRQAWDDEMKKMGIDSPPVYPAMDASCTYFRNVHSGKNCTIVTLNEKFDDGDPVAIMGLLAHEATHVYQDIIKTIGEREPSIEFEAYSIQAITQELAWAWLDTRGRSFKNSKTRKNTSKTTKGQKNGRKEQKNDRARASMASAGRFGYADPSGNHPI